MGQESFSLTIPNHVTNNAAESGLAPDKADKQDKYSFEKLKSKVSRISKQWKDEKALTDERRELRYLNVNVEEERKTGRFKPHEIYIPIRLIDDNIRKEAPQYIAYLTSSRNSAIFKCKTELDPSLDIQVLENSFTKMVRFLGWELPFFKNLDGTQHHGWACVEVVFDSDKPGHFAVEDIAHENLWFSIDLENLQRGPFLVRNCKVTKEEISKFKDVNEEEVANLFKDIDKEEGYLYATTEVQKVFYKNEDNGLIYVCWLCYDRSKTFLRPPKPLWLGKMYQVKDTLTQQPLLGVDNQPVQAKIYETQYPIELLPYIVSENGRLVSVKGRAFFDEYVQEASSSLVSSIVNSWYLASQVMASPSNPVSGGQAEETDIVIKMGKIYSEPLEFFHMPYPDATGMSLVQGLITQNQSETSNVNFAVNNREDSRKTAKEITAAQSQASLLSGVQVTLYSIFLRNVLTRCWSIAKSQMEQGLLETSLNPAFLNYDYDLYSAGDSEVITRDEQLSKLQQAWPVFATTPAAPIILKAIVDLAFPMLAEDINKALTGTNPASIVAAMMATIQGFMKECPQAIQPQDQVKLQQVLQEGQQYLQQNKPTEQGLPHGKPIGENTETTNPTNSQPAQPIGSTSTTANATTA